jgi:hypothetical protein
MSDSEEENNTNSINNISFDNPLRGYSRRHSYYDNAFNMDFEYSYLDLMRNYGTFVSRTHEMYSNMETCISSMIETQNERRMSINRRRERRRTNRSIREQQHLVINDNDNGNDINEHNSILGDSHAPHAPLNDNVLDNPSNSTGTGTATGTATGRRQLFDIGSVIYSIPRTVLLNPSPNTNTNLNNSMLSRRRNGGLTISEIEENTEILTYGSIPSNYILNTECPITRETFTPDSVVLNLKQCRHCFVPFRMMRWLETHSTCPLCRANVIRVETPQINTESNNSTTNNTQDVTNTESNNATTNNTDNINISNIFNNLLQNSNNDFNNLSIDNVSDNSIMFSFDMPSGELNRQNSENNPFIIPQIERLMANTISRNIFNSGTSTYGVTPTTSSNNNNGDEHENEHENERDDEDENYPEVD